MKWKIIDTGPASPQQNMAADYAFLRDLNEQSEPILHLYDWKGMCATYGHFLDPYKYLCRELVQKYQIELAKRPTGGGVVFHFSDFAYSILIPASHPAYTVNTLDNYAFIHSIISEVIEQVFGSKTFLFKDKDNSVVDDSEHFCMAKPTINDVMVSGEKVAGGAQRRSKYGFLHQGTIFLKRPSFDVLSKVILSKAIVGEIFGTHDCEPRCGELVASGELKESLKHTLISTIQKF